MTRPNFLTQPGVWIRTPRSTKSAVDLACAVERGTPHISTGERIAGVVLAIALGVIAAAGLWHWAAA